MITAEGLIKQKGQHLRAGVDRGRGLIPWTFMRCYLETSLQEHFTTTQAERDYLLRIRHPNNCFSAEPKAELGRLTTDMVECPRTVPHFVKRTNRTNRMPGTNSADMEEANRRAVEIMELVDPTTLLSISPPLSE